MRVLLGCLLLLLLGDNLFGQQPAPVLKVDSMPASGIVQLTGWRYHEGDDPSFKEPLFDDSSWETGKYERMEMPAFIADHPSHIGWFRVRFQVPDKVKNNPLAVWIACMGATEAYLNGKLISRIGTIDSDPKKVRPLNQTLHPVPVTLSPDSVQVLALRFAYQTKFPYLKTPYQLTAITVMFGRIENIVGYMYATLRPSYFLFFTFFVGLYFILFVLHTCFYFFYRRGIQNLFYALANLIFTIGWAFMPIMIFTEDTISRSVMQIPFRLTYILSGLFYVLTIYEIFGYRKRKVLWGYFVFAFSVFALSFINDNFLSLLFLMPNLYYIESIRVAWLRRKFHKTTAVVVITALLFNFLSSTLGVYFLSTGSYQLAMFFITCSGAFVAISTSIAIARQFADTNITLQQKLAEVEELNAEKNRILTDQNIVLEENVKLRTRELEAAMENLKSTQSQLIHSEKMASLGELTAGIAHEIQNPLNFVNNFSEVNRELIDEMNGQLAIGNWEEAKETGNYIKENEEKINHHGKRADTIVKNMLLHSGIAKGKKEATDINALADEYLRLAFHGQRAKNESFNAKIETDFDLSIKNIEVVPQDIGKVLLNLLNNAFFTVDEKRKQMVEVNYSPQVSVASKKEGSFVHLSVTDNGNGMNASVKEKIFQPFFTTKPTGQGTGLGLSLSYDIVKAHGGDLLLETKEGSGSRFTIRLPARQELK